MNGFGLVIGAVWAFLVGRRADKLGRNPVGWFILSFLVSPLLSWIILEVCGESKDVKSKKQAANRIEEVKEVEQKTTEVREEDKLESNSETTLEDKNHTQTKEDDTIKFLN